MAKGSIAVRPGQQVAAGAPIGRVGLSGNTEYPHLHITVRKDGAMVDPFAFGAKPGQCDGGRNIWAAASGLSQGYQAGQVLNRGFATGTVTEAQTDAIVALADALPVIAADSESRTAKRFERSHNMDVWAVTLIVAIPTGGWLLTYLAAH